MTILVRMAGRFFRSTYAGPSAAANSTRAASGSTWAAHLVSGARAHAKDDLVDAETGIVVELGLVGDGAERDDGQLSRITSGQFGQMVQAWNGVTQAAASDGHPAVGVLGHRAQHRRSGPAPDERPHPWLLHRFGPGPGRGQVDELTVVFGPVLGPQGLHAVEVLTDQGVATAEVNAMVLRLGPVPAEPQTEGEPASREVVEGGDLLGQDDRIVLGGEQNAGAQAEAAGGLDGRRERHQWAESSLVVIRPHPLDQRRRGVRPDRKVGVLR